MNIDVTGYKIAIALTQRQWNKLIAIETRALRSCLIDPVTEELQRQEASRIEWSGHFGRAIYFEVEYMEQAERIQQFLRKKLR